MSTARKILVIDDEEDLRESLTDQIALHEEFETASAGTAAEGMAKAKAENVDLILMDVGLPDMDGREACKLLRKNGFKGPIVMLTAQASDSDTILGLEFRRQRLHHQAVQICRAAGAHPRPAPPA